MSRRVYEEIRTMVEEHGGSMTYQREGFPPGGAWVVRYKDKERAFPSGGSKFPGIDNLYIPNVAYPKTFYDYKNVLVDGAWEKLLRLLNKPGE